HGVGWCVARARRRAARGDPGADLAPRLRLPRGGALALVVGDGELRPAGDLAAPVVTAPGARRVVIDIAHGREVARAAVGAALDRAVGGEDAAHRARQVLEEELVADACVEVVPGELFAQRPAAQVELRVEA